MRWFRCFLFTVLPILKLPKHPWDRWPFAGTLRHWDTSKLQISQDLIVFVMCNQILIESLRTLAPTWACRRKLLEKGCISITCRRHLGPKHTKAMTLIAGSNKNRQSNREDWNATSEYRNILKFNRISTLREIQIVSSPENTPKLSILHCQEVCHTYALAECFTAEHVMSKAPHRLVSYSNDLLPRELGVSKKIK